MKNRIIIDNIDVSECGNLYAIDYNVFCCANAAKRNSPCNPLESKCIFYIGTLLKCKEHECKELRKYLIDICKVLNIDTSQFLLGANCIEFYAILSDTAINRIKQHKQECEELRNLFEDPEVKIALTDVRTGEREVWQKLGNKAQKYKQALDEIEEIANTDCGYCKNLKCPRMGNILDIISKIKE